MRVRKLLDKEEILSIIRRLAKNIVNYYNSELNLVVVLEGARRFALDLVDEILKIKSIKINIFYIKLSSYGSGTSSSGKVIVEKDIKENLEGKDLLIVEDIVDTGITINFLRSYLLNNKKAGSVRICTLLDKPSRRKVNVELDYVGYEVPNKFVVGYGVDFDGKYRELDYIGFLEQNVDKK